MHMFYLSHLTTEVSLESLGGLMKWLCYMEFGQKRFLHTEACALQAKAVVE